MSRGPSRPLVATFAILAALCVFMVLALVRRRPPLEPLRTPPALDFDEPSR